MIAEILGMRAAEALTGRRLDDTVSGESYRCLVNDYNDLVHRFNQVLEEGKALSKQADSIRHSLNEKELENNSLTGENQRNELALRVIGEAKDVAHTTTHKYLAGNFIETRIKAYAQSVGIETKNKDYGEIQAAMTNTQKHLCNILCIASADFMLFRNYISETCYAIDVLIKDLKTSEVHFTHMTPERRLALADELTILNKVNMNMLMDLNRPSNETSKYFVDQRAKELVSQVKLRRDGQYLRIDASTVPPIQPQGWMNFITQADPQLVLDEIQGRLDDSVKPIMVASGKASEELFPSAVQTNAFGLGQYLYPLTP